ncbi:LOW QUALITY PROTEIN: uncharacterized protein ACRADG_010070 [Cochliomyia hominivorax]
MINWIIFLMPILTFNYNQMPQQLLNILNEMFQCHQYDTLIIINDENHQYLISTKQMNYSKTTSPLPPSSIDLIPKLILTQNSNIKEFEKNSKLLIVFTISENDSRILNILKRILKSEIKTLNLKIMALIFSPTIILKRDLRKYFLNFERLQLYDVLIVPIKSAKINIYYTYRARPRLEIFKKTFNSLNKESYFIEPITNFQGYTLLTYPDQLQPRTLLKYNNNGKIVMLGFIGRLITTYAEKINATLKFPFPIKLNNALFFTDLFEMTVNGSLDIPASLASVNDINKPEYFSRYVELCKWFPMLPVADYFSNSDIYYTLIIQDLGCIFVVLLIIYNILLFLIELLHNISKSPKNIILESFLNDQVFLGLLAFPFKLDYSDRYFKTHRLIILLIQFSGFMLVIFTNTYLASNITTPPKYPEINSFEELNERYLKILMMPQGYRNLIAYDENEFETKYKPIIVPTNISEMVETRNNLNRTVSFGVLTTMWSIYEKQQMYFAEKMFRYSPQMYFNNFMIYALPLPKNSIFEKSLNKLIANLMASGILQNWYESSFFDMIETGHMSFKDFSTARAYAPAQYKDFKIFFFIYIGSIFISCLILFIEIIVYKIKINKEINE